MLPPQKKNPSTEGQDDQVIKALPFLDCLAKTYITGEGQKRQGRTVFNHCQIVGEVAREILNRMPLNLRNFLFPEGSALVAAAHDIGKVSPTFQEKILQATDGYQKNSLPELKTADPDLEKNWGGHAGVSQATASFIKVGKYIPEILGKHHGYSPALTQLSTDAFFGGQAWHEERIQLIQELKSGLKYEWPVITSFSQAQAIAGLTTVSDWIGSGPFFEDPAAEWQKNINPALDDAGFVMPKLRKNLSFNDIFGFYPHNIQQQFSMVVTQPGVYILEAPMGLGKTEAALYAAYKMMDAQNAAGLYFALPTQLTSDKIHQRVNKFLEKVLDADNHHLQAFLLHSNAWLKEMGEEGQPGGAWFNNAKRCILAPFAVGTIDQALMAVMNVKHGFVRTFGLAGKVVILDEVHSYDFYTGTILDELVKTLRSLHCTVIILSATLTYERRKFLTNANLKLSDYPLITAVKTEANLEVISEVAVDDLLAKKVQLKAILDDKEAIEEALLRAELGQQVLWIENTVNEAQEIFEILAARAHSIDISCGLLHSRFIKKHRTKNEEKWVNLFGKEGAKQRNQQGRILIGTQVLEQSLDIDADFLITRFCPTDMLFQRMGRLWRHDHTQRSSGSKCEAWMLVPNLDAAIENPEALFKKSAWVYSPYVLCRSLQIWNTCSLVTLPNDMRMFIEETYSSRQEKGQMFKWLNELNNGSQNRIGRSRLERLALVTLSEGGKTLPENKASTRYSEQDIIECLLVKSIHCVDDKRLTNIHFLNGEEICIPHNGKSLNKKIWREYAAKIFSNTVLIAEHLAPNALSVERLRFLKDYVYLGNQHDEESKFRIGIVQPSGQIKGMGFSDPSIKYSLSYDEYLGYQAIKKEGSFQ